MNEILKEIIKADYIIDNKIMSQIIMRESEESLEFLMKKLMK